MQAFFNKLGIAGELLSFLWAQKLWWMIPLVVMLLLLAALIAFASATSLGPFIYPLIPPSRRARLLRAPPCHPLRRRRGVTAGPPAAGAADLSCSSSACCCRCSWWRRRCGCSAGPCRELTARRLPAPHPIYGRFHVPGFDGWVKTREYASGSPSTRSGCGAPSGRMRSHRASSHSVPGLGSFTQAFPGARQDGVVSRLETALNARGGDQYEVLNGGVGGWGTEELVYLREEGYRYQPCLVVVRSTWATTFSTIRTRSRAVPRTRTSRTFVPCRRGRSSRSSSARASPRISPVVATLRDRSLLWNVFETGVLVKLGDGEDEDELRANRFNANKMIVHAVKPSDRQEDAWRTTLTLLQRVRQLGEERGFRRPW